MFAVLGTRTPILNYYTFIFNNWQAICQDFVTLFFAEPPIFFKIRPNLPFDVKIFSNSVQNSKLNAKFLRQLFMKKNAKTARFQLACKNGNAKRFHRWFGRAMPFRLAQCAANVFRRSVCTVFFCKIAPVFRAEFFAKSLPRQLLGGVFASSRKRQTQCCNCRKTPRRGRRIPTMRRTLACSSWRRGWQR